MKGDIVTHYTPFILSGRKGNFVNNGAQGGLFASINVADGRIATDAYDENGNRYECHPDSGTPFCGEQNYGMEATTYFTTAIIENGDTITPPPVAIQEVNLTDKQTICISPNPAKGQCSVTVADGMRASLKLYTADGRLVETVATDGTPVLLELPWRGVFLLRATTPNGTTTYKIVSR